jgi:hypothetical protein
MLLGKQQGNIEMKWIFRAAIAAISSSSTTGDALKKTLLRAANLSQGSDSMVDGCRALLTKKEKVLDTMNFREAFPYVWSVADVP